MQQNRSSSVKYSKRFIEVGHIVLSLYTVTMLCVSICLLKKLDDDDDDILSLTPIVVKIGTFFSYLCIIFLAERFSCIA